MYRKHAVDLTALAKQLGPKVHVLARMIACCLLACFTATPVTHAADDTARFYGSWTASFPLNGQTVTMLSIHDPAGYKNFFAAPNGNVPAGADRNDASALTWAQKSAAQNDADGLYYLGMIHYTGRGAPRNWKTARDLFTRSAKLGKRLAEQRLSDIYYQTCKPQASYAPNGDYLQSQCPSVDLLSNSW